VGVDGVAGAGSSFLEQDAVSNADEAIKSSSFFMFFFCKPTQCCPLGQ
jgi:hypothetical protein